MLRGGQSATKEASERARPTLNQARNAVGDVFEDNSTAPVMQETKQRQQLAVAGQRQSDGGDAARAPSQKRDDIATDVVKHEPAPGQCESNSKVCVFRVAMSIFLSSSFGVLHRH